MIASATVEMSTDPGLVCLFMPQLLAQSGGLILGNSDGALLNRSEDFVVGSILSSLLAAGEQKSRTFARGFMQATRR
jgi:hypothetical protein